MSTDARFAPGDWYAVVGEHVTVLLPGSQRDRVASLWELADSGASADAVLDALVAGGLSSLDHVALVAHGDDSTRLLVRGAPTATVVATEGEEIVSAAPGTTWAERLVTGVTSVRVTLTGDSDADHPLTPGIARVSVVEFGTPSAAAPAPPTEPVVAEPVEQPVAEPVAPVVAEPEPEPAAPMSFGEPEDDPTPTGETPVVEADDWSDRDGHTVTGPPAPDFDRPPIPGQEIAPEVVSQPVASLVFSTGDVVLVDRTVLVGRAPEARRFASHDQPHVVTVASPHQEISSTHLEIRPGAGADHGSAIATDLGSTNGTVLAQPGLDPEELKPGIAVSLVPGAVLDLGDGVTIQVTNP
ncbi:FHA domain-containing protein [Nocardioides KLBMP 9356]|uniref:FHA domain-containing protein n=1 Tax=Nocardioides potassii TaxID=2911371 RepID=A0ABS9HEY1_9ACTN|nr:FHA domain-containing protein [Nocardioides potassii]MCF6378989.1 FHA domain-containing protein [Nocardioides potassii]